MVLQEVAEVLKVNNPWPGEPVKDFSLLRGDISLDMKSKEELKIIYFLNLL